MFLYDIQRLYSIQQLAASRIGSSNSGGNVSLQELAQTRLVTEFSGGTVFTLTALVAPISMSGLLTFSNDELHTLTESVCFHIEADEVPLETRCSCLRGGRFCLKAEHWLLEFGTGSPFWLGEDGKPRAGSVLCYAGPKKGEKSIFIGEFQERICCVEGLGECKKHE